MSSRQESKGSANKPLSANKAQNKQKVKETEKPNSKQSSSKPINPKPKALFIYDKFPPDIKETLLAMDENQTELKKLIGKGIKVNKFLEFEAKCEELLGIEINSIIDYFSHKYATTKDKFIITFEDFIDITQKWADSYFLKEDEHIMPQANSDPLKEEKLEMQVKSRDNLVLKFDRHQEKI